MGKFLSSEFLDSYKSIVPKYKGPLFEIIFLGKYSRRPETWIQLCERVVEYSLSLYKGSANFASLKRESELMFDYMFHCKAFPSGRTMRIGGTEASRKFPESSFNCAYLSIEAFEDFCDLFHLSMCSCGVGFSVLKEDIEKLPILNSDFFLSHTEYKYTDSIKLEESIIENFGWQGDEEVILIIVGDSKQGWVQALRFYFEILTSKFNKVKIIFNYDYVRPSGSPLETWGGYAAGPEGLQFMFDKISSIVKKSNGKLKPIDCLDICNIIGANVVVGGSRRAAEICLFDDPEIFNAKSKEDIGYWVDSLTKEETEYDQQRQIEKEIEWKQGINDHRTMSNNSVLFKKKPSYEELQKIFESIKFNGEPGFFNLEAAKKRRLNVKGINPCVTADTWIETDLGPRQVSDLLDKSFMASVQGSFYKATPFFCTGIKEVYRLTTEEGYELKLTRDHKVETAEGWKEAGDLQLGDTILLNGGGDTSFKSLEFIGQEKVYDCTIDEIHKFSANGLIVHNCGEILLDSKGMCNLTTINLMAYLTKDKKIDWASLEEGIRLITRIGLRMTNVELSLSKWSEVQRRDRLLGVSKTGEMDFLDALGWKRNNDAHLGLIAWIGSISNKEADRYSEEMKVNRPLLVTCTKPEGSISLLPTVSCGVGRSYAPYFIRRIKFADFDPMAKALVKLGVPYEKDKTKKNSNRLVFSFPIKSPAKISAKDELFRDQFMGYIYQQRHYADHNTSCTLLVGEDEWQEALDLTYEYWDEIIAVSFLRKEINGVYIQLPYEQITQEQYEQMMETFPNLDKLPELVNNPELLEENTGLIASTIEDSADCSTGACPVV